MLTHGNVPHAASVPIGVPFPGCSSMPGGGDKRQMVGYAHRVEVIYLAWERDPHNVLVQTTIARGMPSCVDMHEDTPWDVLVWTKGWLNTFCGKGIAKQFPELLTEAKRANNQFQAYAKQEGIKSDACGKGEFSWRGRMETYVFTKYPGKWSSMNSFVNTKSIGTYLTDNGLMPPYLAMMKIEVRHSDPRIKFDHLISTQHKVVVTVGHYKNWLTKAEHDLACMELLRMCCPRIVNGQEQEWLFVGGSEILQ